MEDDDRTASLDIWLVRVLRTLLLERSVTQAALRLNQTQPAISTALRKLRETLNDPILVRGKSGMVPTEYGASLLGAASHEAVAAHRNLGAVNAAGLEWGVRPGFQNSQVGAQCVDGILKITRPKSPSLRLHMGWLEEHRVRGFNLFYADLEADAEARLAVLLGRPGLGRLAPPLEGSVVIRPSPVHRVR